MTTDDNTEETSSIDQGGALNGSQPDASDESNLNNAFNDASVTVEEVQDRIVVIDANVLADLNEMYLSCFNGEITVENYLDCKQKLERITNENLDDDSKNKYFHVWNKIAQLEIENKIKENQEANKNVKSEILNMMALFFAVFTFIQINFSFIGQALEKYNGYRLILFCVIINVVLLISLSYILQIIMTIIYGENKAWECREDGQYYLFEWMNLKASKFKLKRTLFHAIIILIGIGFFAFQHENKRYSKSYDEMKKEIMSEIDEKIKLTDSNDLKKADIEKVRENLKNEIEIDLLKNK